jgi:hypothetical protein
MERKVPFERTIKSGIGGNKDPGIDIRNGDLQSRNDVYDVAWNIICVFQGQTPSMERHKKKCNDRAVSRHKYRDLPKIFRKHREFITLLNGLVLRAR